MYNGSSKANQTLAWEELKWQCTCIFPVEILQEIQLIRAVSHRQAMGT